MLQSYTTNTESLSCPADILQVLIRIFQQFFQTTIYISAHCAFFIECENTIMHIFMCHHSLHRCLALNKKNIHDANSHFCCIDPAFIYEAHMARLLVTMERGAN